MDPLACEVVTVTYWLHRQTTAVALQAALATLKTASGSAAADDMVAV
jgi:hypothetical protein